MNRSEYQRNWVKKNPKKAKLYRQRGDKKKDLWWFGEDFPRAKTREARYEYGRKGEEIAKILLPFLGFEKVIWFNNNSVRAFFDFKAEINGKICVVEVTTGRSKDISPTNRSGRKMSYPEIAAHLGLEYYVLFISLPKMMYCLRKTSSHQKNISAMKKRTFSISSTIQNQLLLTDEVDHE